MGGLRASIYSKVTPFLEQVPITNVYQQIVGGGRDARRWGVVNNRIQRSFHILPFVATACIIGSQDTYKFVASGYPFNRDISIASILYGSLRLATG